MLLPEPVRDLSVFDGRPAWVLLWDGVSVQREARREDWVALRERSLVVAGRAHAQWYGPVVGFRVAVDLRSVWLTEVLGVDECPWASDDARSWLERGVVAALDWIEFAAARRKEAAVPNNLERLIVPEPVRTAAVRQWLSTRGYVA